MPTLREITAYHEAGHAVIALRLGAKVRRATIKPGVDSWGMVTLAPILRRDDLDYDDGPQARMRAERFVLTSLAGPFAQKRFAPDSNWRDHNRTDFLDGPKDFDHVRDIVDRMHGDDIGNVARKYHAYVKALAEKLVAYHWGDIEVVAKALLQRETLTGKEIWQVIDEAFSRQIAQAFPP